jgi:hypothetical protein
MAQPLHFDAINPFTGRFFTFDDPNLKFINGIGMYLEPSDPGFIPYADALPTPQTQKPKPMKHQDWYPSRIADQIIWLENFRQKIAAYAATLGLEASVVAAIIAECRWLIYVLGAWLPAFRTSAQAATDAATAAQTGSGAGVMTLPGFTAPALPGPEGTLPAVVPMAPGGLGRIFAFVQDIKPAASDAIQTDLRIVGSETPGPDLDNIQPVLPAKVTGTTVGLPWKWDGLSEHVDLLQIQVDRSDGKGYVDLVHDTTPGYTDTTPFPTARTVWTYRSIWHVNGAPIGQWSAPVSVAVGG